jgi:hypothetical protein
MHQQPHLSTTVWFHCILLIEMLCNMLLVRIMCAGPPWHRLASQMARSSSVPLHHRLFLPNVLLVCCVTHHGCRSTMAQAGESDGKVIQRLRDHEAAFAALTPDAAANQLPRLQVRNQPCS